MAVGAFEGGKMAIEPVIFAIEPAGVGQNNLSPDIYINRVCPVEIC